MATDQKKVLFFKHMLALLAGLCLLTITARAEFDLDTLDRSMEKVFNSTLSVQGKNKALGDAMKAVRITEVALIETTKVMKQMDWVKCFQTMSKALTALGPALMVASAVLGIVAAFMPQKEDPQLKFLRESFEEVNFKLEGLSSNLYSMEQSLLLGQGKTMVVPAIHTIDVLEEELEFALSQRTRASLLYFAQTYYANNHFAADRLWNFLVGQNTTGSEEYDIDFLSSVQKSSMCNQMSITRVCLKGLEEINKGIVQQSIYFGIIRYPQRVKYLPTYWEEKQIQLREKCTEKMQECEESYEYWATKAIENFYQKNVKILTPKLFSERLYNLLEQQFPFRRWSVYASQSHELGDFKCIYHKSYTFFERLMKNGRNVIVIDRKQFSNTHTSAINDELRKLGEYTKTTGSCNAFRKGPLYYSDSKHFISHLVTVAPNDFLASCPLYADAHLTTAKDHWFAYTFFKSYCLAKDVRVLVSA